MVPASGTNGVAQLQRVNLTAASTASGSTSSSTPIVITNGSHIDTSSPSSSLTTTTTGGGIELLSDQHDLTSVGDENQHADETGGDGEAAAGDDEEEEPLYVNAKQYNRILKRRIARAKLESEGRIPKIRQVCGFEDYSVEISVNKVGYFVRESFSMSPDIYTP